MEVSEVQFMKACAPIVVTPAGILNCSSVSLLPSNRKTVVGGDDC